MLDKRGLNKKAQEGVTTTTLLVIVLGIVVVVLVIIGATGGLDFIFSKFKVVPGQSLETVIQSCNTAAQAQLKGDFCLTFKSVSINNVNQYVTCDYSGISSSLNADGQSFVSECGDNAAKLRRDAAYCFSGTIKGTDLSKVLVNGQTCSQKFGINGSVCTPGQVANGVSIYTNIPAPCNSGDTDISAVLKPANTNAVCCLNVQSA